ncbi:hypothetical protein [Brevibacillus halotolerans]|uniref:hypothetical protein n=1 Tax=Brevibacillus halotolerans TaxID=1507437 RepID=UPI001FE81605|nr:hypothetical protein [Brevibacillus halotolerans]
MAIQLERNTTTLQQIERSPNDLENELQNLKKRWANDDRNWLVIAVVMASGAWLKTRSWSPK